MIKSGIDLSHHNGKVDFSKLNIDFAILRMGYSDRSGQGGLNMDKQFARNVNGMKDKRIPFGIYVYCYDETVNGAKKTAAAVINELEEMKHNGIRCEYPIYYDIEYGQSKRYCYNDLRSVKNNTDMVIAFCEELEKAGYYCGVYASRNFFEYYLDMERLRSYDKWVADYTSGNINWSHGMRQLSSRGVVNGVYGNVDINKSYYDYPTIIKRSGLNGFDATRKSYYEVTVGPMSVGDRDKIISMANMLDIKYDVKEV